MGDKKNEKVLLIDTFSMKFHMTEDVSKSGKLIGEGRFGYVDKPTANKRIYPRAIMEKEIARLQDDMQKRRIYGELDHPGDGKTKLSRSSHLVLNATVQEDGEIVGSLEVLQNSKGKDLQAIVDQGGEIGVSSRGYGSVKTTAEGFDIVQEDFTLLTWDAVADPAAAGSYPVFEYTDNASVATVQPDVAAAMTPVSVPNAAPVESKEKKVEGALLTENANAISLEDVAKLKEEFKTELLSKLQEEMTKVREEVRQEMLNDPSLAGAKTALESIKEAIRPFVLSEDVNLALAEKDLLIKGLEAKVESLSKDNQAHVESLNEFSSVTKELGFKLYVERLVTGNMKREEILAKVGDVNAFESIDTLKAKVDAIVSDCKLTEAKVKAISTEKDAEVKQLAEQVESLHKQLSSALTVGKNFGVMAYLHQRIRLHPKAEAILAEAKTLTLEGKSDVDELMEKHRIRIKETNREDGYRSRIRNLMGGKVVEQSLKGTRPEDRRAVQESSEGDQVHNLTGSTAADIARLSGIKL